LGIFLRPRGDTPFIQMIKFKKGYNAGSNSSEYLKEDKMRTFLIVGQSSPQELKEISMKYRTEVVSLVNSFGGTVRSMYVMLRERYLILTLSFPGVKMAMSASIALSKLTGIPFTASPAVLIEKFNNLLT